MSPMFYQVLAAPGRILPLSFLFSPPFLTCESDSPTLIPVFDFDPLPQPAAALISNFYL